MRSGGKLALNVSYCVFTAFNPQQWEAAAAGQAAGASEGARTPRSHLLPDGAHAGHPGRLPQEQTVPIPG